MPARIPGIINRVADTAKSDESIKNIDGALDAIIGGLITIEKNIPNIKPQNAAQTAAKDEMQKLLDEAMMPYTADFAKTIDLFGG